MRFAFLACVNRLGDRIIAEAAIYSRGLNERCGTVLQQALKVAREEDELRGAFIVAADTVVAVGRRILPKVEDEATLRECMRLLSGRRHRVLTGVAVAMPGEPTRSRVVETMIAMKRLSDAEVEFYAGHGEWHGKAGGYALQGYGEVYVRHIAGSYSNVVGLPLAETRLLLKSAGYPLA